MAHRRHRSRGCSRRFPRPHLSWGIGRAEARPSQPVVTPDNPIFALQDAPNHAGFRAGPAAAGADAGAADRWAWRTWRSAPVQLRSSPARRKHRRRHLQGASGGRRRSTTRFRAASWARTFSGSRASSARRIGAGFGGQGVDDRVVRWEQQGNRVFLRLVNYDLVADPKEPIAQAVADANNPTIIRAFNVAAISPIGNLVIDVTNLFTTRRARVLRPPEPRRARHGPEPDLRREGRLVSAEHQRAGDADVHERRRAPGAGAPACAARSGTVVVFHSMVRLPDTPMMAAPLRRARRVLRDGDATTSAATRTRRSSARSSCATGSRRRTRPPPCPIR